MSRSFESTSADIEAYRTHEYMSTLAFEALLQTGLTREIQPGDNQHYLRWYATADKRHCDLSCDDIFTDNPRYTFVTSGENTVNYHSPNAPRRYKFDASGEEFTFEDPISAPRPNGYYSRQKETDRLISYFNLALPHRAVRPDTKPRFNAIIGQFMIAHNYDLYDQDFVRPRRYIEQIANTAESNDLLFEDTVEMLFMDRRPNDPFSISRSVFYDALKELRGNGLPDWLTNRQR